MPTLANGHNYYVRYGPNSDNEDYVYVWFGPDISSYVSGSTVHGGDFDIANVQLTSPPPGATESLPVDFSWYRRPVPTDTYRWIMFDLDTGSGWRTNDLGYVDGVSITGLPNGAQYGKAYGWYARPYNGDGSYGLPYYFRRITFSASAVNAADERLMPMSDMGVPGKLELHSPFEEQIGR